MASTLAASALAELLLVATMVASLSRSAWSRDTLWPPGFEALHLETKGEFSHPD